MYQSRPIGRSTNEYWESSAPDCCIHWSTITQQKIQQYIPSPGPSRENTLERHPTTVNHLTMLSARAWGGTVGPSIVKGTIGNLVLQIVALVGKPSYNNNNNRSRRSRPGLDHVVVFPALSALSSSHTWKCSHADRIHFQFEL